MSEFKCIGLIGRPGHDGVIESLTRFMLYLQSKEVSIMMDDVTSELVRNSSAKVVTRAQLGANCDLLVVVGGDGSILNAAKHVVSKGVPVIGINRGKLGFLTDILPGEIESQFDEVLAGNYTVENKFLLDVKVKANVESNLLGLALNDVVLHPGKAAQMIEFELFINDQFVYSQESDGLIVATPTGSTAYSLSAGGPITHPDLNAVVLVPMYPHSLNSRPIVIDGDCEIKIVVAAKESLQPQVSCDGEVCYTASASDELFVTKNSNPLKLIHPPNHSFYQACRSKLGWGSRLARPDD
ncbi:MAG: NAD(+) kinase [Gammaproteobacteria bacterium]|nr:NAD(+) kinase [Gammaproteobacteria bacterium]